VWQTDRRTSCDGIVRAMHTRRAVKTARSASLRRAPGTVCHPASLRLRQTRSPAGAGIANRPLGIFLIFGSNTPTWSVENQLNLWATNYGYFGPLYASRHQTSLWRHQHILFCSTSADGVAWNPAFYFAYSSYKAGISGYRRVGSFVNTALLMPQITPHNPRLQVAYSDLLIRNTVLEAGKCGFAPIRGWCPQTRMMKLGVQVAKGCHFHVVKTEWW